MHKNATVYPGSSDRQLILASSYIYLYSTGYTISKSLDQYHCFSRENTLRYPLQQLHEREQGTHKKTYKSKLKFIIMDGITCLCDDNHEN